MARFTWWLLMTVLLLAAGPASLAQAPGVPGAVQTPPGDVCSGVRCPPGQRCVPRGDHPYCMAAGEGAAPSACDSNPCPAGMRCTPQGQGGFCCQAGELDADHSTGSGTAETCAGIRCPEGQRCVVTGGRPRCAPALPDPCAAMRCPAGQQCVVESTGAVRCVAVRPRPS